MSTSTGAPLNLTKPAPGDAISLAVLNANFDSINTTAGDHESRLDVVEAANWVTTSRITDANVTNAKIASGVNGDKVTSGSVYNSTRWAGRKLHVSSTAPTTDVVDGDVWLKVQ